MAGPRGSAEELLRKLEELPPDKAVEVEDFIDFLREREKERRLAQSTSMASEPAFAHLWDNPDDAAYDDL